MRQALEMALEALEDMAEFSPTRLDTPITAIKEILAQPEQEPVAWIDMAYARLGMVRDKMSADAVATVQSFLEGDYTTPPQRTWVGVTVEEMDNITAQRLKWQVADLVDAIEAKLKEKNHDMG